MSASPLESPQVRWDLSVLFSGFDDPRVDAVWTEAHARADAFEERYRGRIDSPSLTASTLAEALRTLESIYQDAAKPMAYASLRFAEDSSSPDAGAFMSKQMEQQSALSIKVLFFDLELKSADEAVIAPLLGDPALANYRHVIQTTRAFAPYKLSEAQEVILEEFANTGSRAWERLHDELTSNHVYRLQRPGADAPEEASEQEVLALLRDPDRALRQAGADALSAGLAEMERVLVFIYNTLLQDKATEDRVRGYEYAEQHRHLSNELPREVVDQVVRLCREHYSLVARYYRVKREILGLPELTHIDRYAPLFEAEEQVDWESARQIVLDAFGKFHPELRTRAAEFFDQRWIDAESRKGKAGGAFCAYVTPDTHPYVLQTYLNRMDDVMTLAHELGHGVHASLSRSQSYFNFHGTLPLAELASIFGEMLVFESLVAEASLKDKVAIYADKIEGMFATVFRQSSMFAFEQRCHQHRREEGELTPDTFGDYWQSELQAMFGDSVRLGDQHRRWWSYVPHFIGSPFYVYAYSFGELLVLSLYQMAKAEGPDFGDKYIALLRKGGSETPDALMASVGVDLRSEAFWRNGFAAIEAMVSEFERLWAEYRAA